MNHILHLGLIFCILSSFSTSSTPTTFECNYNNLNFYTLNDLYTCDVKNNPNIINEPSAFINSISGGHLTSKSNNDVAGLYLYNKIVNYFPKNLENFFKILKLIYINGCGLKEVHQEDLKPFVDLVFLYLGNNVIEVIEQDLFAYNPNLDFISFDNNKIVHIDSNVFDNLDKLSCFWFAGIPCFGQQASNTREKTVELISITKYKCKNSEIRNIGADIKYLEDNVKVFNPEGLKDKFEALEKNFGNSRFSKFRPLKNKFEDLKKIFNPDQVVINSPTTEISPKTPEITSNSCQIPTPDSTFDSLELKLNNFWNDKLTKIDNNFDDLKTSQCGAKDTLTELLTSQTILNNLKTSQNEAKSSINNLNTKISIIISSQESSQTQMTSTLNSLQANLNNLKDITKQSQDDIKTSLSDIEATFSDTKIFQNDVKTSLNKLKTTQNEIKISLNEIKAAKSENSDEKLTFFGEKLESFEGKLGNIETNFEEFEVKNAAKLDKIEREFTTNRHKISINFDEKIKRVEKRMMKKFEEILEEKLGKIIEEKLMSVIDSKFGKD